VAGGPCRGSVPTHPHRTELNRKGHSLWQGMGPCPTHIYRRTDAQRDRKPLAETRAVARDRPSDASPILILRPLLRQPGHTSRGPGPPSPARREGKERLTSSGPPAAGQPPGRAGSHEDAPMPFDEAAPAGRPPPHTKGLTDRRAKPGRLQTKTKFFGPWDLHVPYSSIAGRSAAGTTFRGKIFVLPVS